MLSHKKSLDILRKTNALLEGHFILSSGLHSSKYIQCAKLLSYPSKAEKICKSLALKIKKNKRRIKLSEKDLHKRSKLKSLIMDKKTSIDDRFQAQLKLSKLRRNGARTRVRNRCELTGRPRGYHKRVRLSRIALRDLASKGQIPGMNKSSW